MSFQDGRPQTVGARGELLGMDMPGGKGGLGSLLWQP